MLVASPKQSDHDDVEAWSLPPRTAHLGLLGDKDSGNSSYEWRKTQMVLILSKIQF